MNYAIEIQNLSKHYPNFTLDNLSLALPSGSIMGFIGENGAGKSTTIKLILDLIHRDSGEIQVMGQDLRTCEDLKEHIGVVMDESSFPDNLRPREINTIMANCYKTWDSARFNAYLSTFSLPSNQPVKEFSRGMGMKLSIAVALSHDSKLLILDEPTSGLDPIVRNELLDLFLDFIQDESHSIFLSSHILSDLEKICDYIAFIHGGKLLFCEPKDVLLDRYRLVKCSEEDLQAIDSAFVAGKRRSAFGTEALVLKEAVPGGLVTDRPTIEDIMLYCVKEED